MNDALLLAFAASLAPRPGDTPETVNARIDRALKAIELSTTPADPRASSLSPGEAREGGQGDA